MANTSITNGSKKPARQKIDPARIEFKRLSADCPRGAFSCGYEHIDRFFNDRSLDEHTGLFARTVTAHLDGAAEPVGFYAMAIGPEPADQFAEEPTFVQRIAAVFKSQQLTTVQLLWFGVQTGLQRQGIGTLLMGHALDDFYQVVDRTGVAALTLQPISSNAAAFYTEIGFRPYGSGKRMLLSADAVLEVRRSAQA
jgi:GNAT superfamily N-acetyltransferase